MYTNVVFVVAKRVLFIDIEVSSFQGEGFLLSCLLRCPHFRRYILEGFHLVEHITCTFNIPSR